MRKAVEGWQHIVTAASIHYFSHSLQPLIATESCELSPSSIDPHVGNVSNTQRQANFLLRQAVVFFLVYRERSYRM